MSTRRNLTVGALALAGSIFVWLGSSLALADVFISQDDERISVDVWGSVLFLGLAGVLVSAWLHARRRQRP